MNAQKFKRDRRKRQLADGAIDYDFPHVHQLPFQDYHWYSPSVQFNKQDQFYLVELAAIVTPTA